MGTIQVGNKVATLNGHVGEVIKIYKVTGCGFSVHILEADGRIYYCPISYCRKLKKYDINKTVPTCPEIICYNDIIGKL